MVFNRLNARQLFGPIRAEEQRRRRKRIPSSVFSPELPCLFKLAICSPCDMRFAPKIMSTINEQAPSVVAHGGCWIWSSTFWAYAPQRNRLPVIDYARFDEQGFSSTRSLPKTNWLWVTCLLTHALTVKWQLKSYWTRSTLNCLVFTANVEAFWASIPWPRLHAFYERYEPKQRTLRCWSIRVSDDCTRWMVEHAAKNKENLQILDFPFDNAAISWLPKLARIMEKIRDTFGHGDHWWWSVWSSALN